MLDTILIFKLFPEEGVFGIHKRAITWSWSIIWYGIIPILAGLIFVYFFLYLEKVFTKLESWKLSPIFKAILWGLVLSSLTLITDYTLFSGEFHIVPFSKTALSYSSLFLLVIALIKTLSTIRLARR
ncbi:chloride channel protein [Lactobacillus taiwanensis]|uniref:chloride channel protein n=1 Tax=Lactobacillus taiwanensis TaxID=508451 RepID=UPI00338DA154